jgi:uncharacterized linocin/CFP29 family protein
MTQTALQRAATYLDGEIVEPLRQKTMARQLITVKPKVKGDGIKAAEVMKVVDMGRAQIAYRLPKDMSRDMIRIDKTTVDIPFLFKGYEVDREAIEAYAREQIALDTAAAVSAAQAIGVMEDEAIITGWIPDGAAYKMPGLFESGTTHYVTTKDFGTYGDAKTAVAALISQLEVLYVYPPFNLVLNPIEHGQLVMSESSTGTEEYARIVRIINGNTEGGPGRIFSSPNITAGKGMLSPVDTARVYMELLNPQPVRNVLGEDSKMPGISDITGTTYEALYVHVKQPAAIGILDDINGA